MKTRRLQSPGLLSGFGIFHSSFCSRIEPPLLPRGLNPGLAFPCRQIVSLNRPLCRRRPLLPRSSFAVCVLECSSLQLSVHSMRKPSRPAQGLKSTLGLSWPCILGLTGVLGSSAEVQSGLPAFCPRVLTNTLITLCCELSSPCLHYTVTSSQHPRSQPTPRMWFYTGNWNR